MYIEAHQDPLSAKMSLDECAQQFDRGTDHRVM